MSRRLPATPEPSFETFETFETFFRTPDQYFAQGGRAMYTQAPPISRPRPAAVGQDVLLPRALSCLNACPQLRSQVSKLSKPFFGPQISILCKVAGQCIPKHHPYLDHAQDLWGRMYYPREPCHASASARNSGAKLRHFRSSRNLFSDPR